MSDTVHFRDRAGNVHVSTIVRGRQGAVLVDKGTERRLWLTNEVESVIVGHVVKEFIRLNHEAEALVERHKELLVKMRDLFETLTALNVAGYNLDMLTCQRESG